jgi:hypothetical protein
MLHSLDHITLRPFILRWSGEEIDMMPENTCLTRDTRKRLDRHPLLRVAATGDAPALRMGASALPVSARPATAVPGMYAMAGTSSVQVAFRYGKFSEPGEKSLGSFEVTNYSGGSMSQVLVDSGALS